MQKEDEGRESRYNTNAMTVADTAEAMLERINTVNNNNNNRRCHKNDNENDFQSDAFLSGEDVACKSACQHTVHRGEQWEQIQILTPHTSLQKKPKRLQKPKQTPDVFALVHSKD